MTGTLVMSGDAVDVLTDAAIAEEAGLLVVGSRGVGGITGLRLGTTALKVLHRAQIPVLMVPGRRDGLTRLGGAMTQYAEVIAELSEPTKSLREASLMSGRGSATCTTRRWPRARSRRSPRS